MRRVCSQLLVAGVCFAVQVPGALRAGTAPLRVSVTPAFFNPAIGQSETIRISGLSSGSFRLEIPA
jgi:hypothetical protein